MKTTIQDLTAIVLSLGVLFLAAKSTLKKANDLLRYAKKISKATRPTTAQQPSAAPARTDGREPSFYDHLPYILAASAITAVLYFHAARTTPITRLEVIAIGFEITGLLGLYLSWYTMRLAQSLTKLAHELGRFGSSLQELAATMTPQSNVTNA